MTLLTTEELTDLARQAVAASGMTQVQLAEVHGVTQTDISLAANRPDRSVHNLRIRLIREYLGIEVSGPVPRFEVMQGREL